MFSSEPTKTIYTGKSVVTNESLNDNIPKVKHIKFYNCYQPCSYCTLCQKHDAVMAWNKKSPQEYTTIDKMWQKFNS